MPAPNGKEKSRLGRNLSALLTHSEESLFKVMQLKRRSEERSGSAAEEAALLDKEISFESAGKDQPDLMVATPPADDLSLGPVGIEQPDVMTDSSFVDEFLPLEKPANHPAADQRKVISRLTIKQRGFELDEDDLKLSAGEPFTIAIAVNLPLLSKRQTIPPVVSKLAVYVLLNDPDSGARLRMETNSASLDRKRRMYEFAVPMEGLDAGSYELCVHIYAALYGFSERQVMNLLIS